MSLRGTVTGLKVRLRQDPTGRTIEKTFTNEQVSLAFMEAEAQAGREWSLVDATQVLAPEGRQAHARVIDSQILERSCLADETDDACKARVEAETRRAHPEAQIEVGLQGDLLGYQTEFLLDDQRVSRLFGAPQAAAEFMRTQKSRGRRILLVSSVLKLDPKTRRAQVHLIPTRVQRADVRPWLRLEVRMPGEPTQTIRSLMEQTNAAGIQVMRYEPQPDGSIQLDLRCP